MPETILIVEDDQSIRLGLEEVLTSEGFRAVSWDTGDQRVEELLEEEAPSLIILDVMLPVRDGVEICRSLRQNGTTTPILMLTAKGQELDKVVGLDSGADDYVTKPFGVKELVARIRALLRRSRNDVAKDIFHVGPAEINPKSFEVTLNGKAESLTPKELQLLQCLHRRRGEALTRDNLLQEVWGVHYYGTTRTLDQTIAQLRKKLGDSGSAPKSILTVHGVGYRLAEESGGTPSDR